MGTAAYDGGNGATLYVDAYLGPPGSGSDLMKIGSSAGTTWVVVHDTNSGAGSYNPKGIPVVQVYDGGSVQNPGNFLLSGGPVDKGLFTYDLYFDNGTSPQSKLPKGIDDQWVLASTPNARAFQLATIQSGIQTLWNDGLQTWHDRTTDLRNVPGAPAVRPSGAWLVGFGSQFDRDVTHTVTAFNTTTQVPGDYRQFTNGAIGGIDTTISNNGRERWVVGLLGGFESSSLHFTNSPTASTDLQGNTVGGYATYLKDGLFIDTLVKGDFLTVKHHTTGAFADQASGSATAVGVIVDGGYRMDGAGGSYVEPLATLAYVRTTMDSFGFLGNQVSFPSGENVEGRLGLRVGTTLPTSYGRFNPFLTASLWQTFTGSSPVTFSAPGSPDLTISDDSTGTFYEFGGGGELFTANGTSAFIKGDYRWGNGVTGGTVRGGLRASW